MTRIVSPRTYTSLIAGFTLAILFFALPAEAQIVPSGDTFDAMNGGFPRIGKTSAGALLIEGGVTLNTGGSAIGESATGVGAVLVTGMGSQWIDDGFLLVGDEGTGSLVIDDFAVVNISDAGPAGTGDGFTAIAAFAGSTGSVTVKNGGRFNIGPSCCALKVGAGHLDGFFGIPGASSVGSLNVQSGGVVEVQQMIVGDDPNSSGTVNVNGAGSEIRGDMAVGPLDMAVGQHGAGTVDITNGGKLTTVFAQLGRAPDGKGVINVSGTDSLLNMEGIDSGGFAGFLNIGRDGFGALNVSDGGKALFDPIEMIMDPDFGGGFNVARNPEGTGNVSVIEMGSEIRVKGGFGFVGIGRRGTGNLTVGTGAAFVIEDGVDGRMFVAPANRSVGTVRILGERKNTSGMVIEVIPTELDAGALFAMGLGSDETSNAGVATLIVDSGGTLTAVDIKVGASGTIFLNGTLNGAVTNGGTINPGFSPGTGTISGDVNFTSDGVLNIEVEGTQAGEFDKLNVGGAVTFAPGSTIQVQISDAVPQGAPTIVIIRAAAVIGEADVVFTDIPPGGAVPSVVFDPAGTVAITFAVPDTTPPGIVASLAPVGAGDDGDDDGADSDEGRFRIEFSATDAVDPEPVVMAVLVIPNVPEIEVADGQIIEFEFDDEETNVELVAGILEIEASELALRVTATDASGNSAVAEVQPAGPGADDDDDSLASADSDDD